jgi:formylmethanofuran dehydrogenase subunit E
MAGPDIAGKVAEREIKELVAIAAEVGIGQEDFAEMVADLKKEEAQAINNSGLQRQLEYIFSTYGPAVEFVKRAKRRVLENMKDYAPPGKLIQCAACGETEFRSRAHRAGEGWSCADCWAINDLARAKAEERAKGG